MSPHDESERLQAVARLYAEYLERRKRGERLGLEEFCAAHGEHAEALKQLDLEWERWKTVFDVLASSRARGASRGRSGWRRNCASVLAMSIRACRSGASGRRKTWGLRASS